MHFERCSIINGWDSEEKSMLLTGSLGGDSRKLLDGLTYAESRSYEKIVEDCNCDLVLRNKRSYTRRGFSSPTT